MCKCTEILIDIRQGSDKYISVENEEGVWLRVVGKTKGRNPFDWLIEVPLIVIKRSPH